MLSELVDDFIEDKNVVVTAAAGNGATSFCLYLANILLRKNKLIVYFDPQDNIEQSFVKKFYPRVYQNVVFVACGVQELLWFLQYIDYKVDYLIMDPADCLMYNTGLIPMIADSISGTIVCTSQIRQDPSQGGKIYSTIEKKFMDKIFNYSVWIRNVTEGKGALQHKYIDIFDKTRSGNNQIARYMGTFSSEGNIIG